MLAAKADCKAGTVMNCACHRQITLNQLVQKINEILNKKITPIYKKARPGDIKHSFASVEAAKKHLGYKALVDFDSGLRATIKWYQSKLGR
jgi:nucleoside-diphosphate-sugar epimerase